jgi:hypothetical protein
MRPYLCQGKKDKEFRITMSNNYARCQILLIYRNFPATILAGVAIEQQCVNQEHAGIIKNTRPCDAAHRLASSHAMI